MIQPGPIDARSFRDPDGVVRIVGDRVLRLVERAAAERLDTILARPSVRAAMAAGKIVGTRRAASTSLPGALRELNCVVYEHDRIPFVSYAHEWPPAMLARAATFTVELAEELLADGLVLKDATPANVLFNGTQPVLVDILSIVPRERGEYLWLAANQFEATFLLPLIANAQTGLPLSWMLQDTYSGLSHRQVARLVGVRRWLKPSLIRSVALPAALAKDSGSTAFKTARHSNDEVATFILQRTLSRLRRQVAAVMRPRQGSSFWKRYTVNRAHYAPQDLHDKKAFVAAALAEIRPQWTLDIGANTGEFSLLAAQSSNVVAMEVDETSADEIFRQAAAAAAPVQSLVGNFARPSPGLGWDNGEMEAFMARVQTRFDLVLMLAVVHHLRIAAGIPIAAVLAAAAAVCRSHLIVEHVPPTDAMFRQLARGRDLYGDCERDRFEEELGRRFALVQRRELSNGRTLYLSKRLTADGAAA
jgi:hypothetical protein